MVGCGARVTISDRGTAEQLAQEIAELDDLPVELVLGGHPLSLLDGCHLLCLSGGVPLESEIAQQAIARGIPLSNDTLLTLQMLHSRPDARRPRHIVGITGSSGKTTTTTLVGKMLEAAGIPVHVGGNIGTPLIDRLDQIRGDDVVVLELSSFQLQLLDPAVTWGQTAEIGPTIGAVLNITPNHLDRHGTMAAYADAKFNLFRTMPENATVILNADDPVTGALLPPEQRQAAPPPADWALSGPIASMRAVLSRKKVDRVAFGLELGGEEATPQGARWRGSELLLDGRPLCRTDELLLRGDHNVMNVLAAAAVAAAAGADDEAICTVARTFAGVPHRLEIVAETDGVLWINDSIATSPERAVAALRCFDPAERTIILLAGGKDKDLPWEPFAAEAVARVTMLIGFGHAGPMIVRTVQEIAEASREPAPSSAVVQRLDEAVELAGRSAAPNTVVLLSPGGTSYDAYRDFEARGEHFRRLIAAFKVERNAGRSGIQADNSQAEMVQNARHRAPGQTSCCQPGSAATDQPAEQEQSGAR